jgi:hypothetical protein
VPCLAHCPPASPLHGLGSLARIASIRLVSCLIVASSGFSSVSISLSAATVRSILAASREAAFGLKGSGGDSVLTPAAVSPSDAGASPCVSADASSSNTTFLALLPCPQPRPCPCPWVTVCP